MAIYESVIAAEHIWSAQDYLANLGRDLVAFGNNASGDHPGATASPRRRFRAPTTNPSRSNTIFPDGSHRPDHFIQSYRSAHYFQSKREKVDT